MKRPQCQWGHWAVSQDQQWYHFFCKLLIYSIKALQCTNSIYWERHPGRDFSLWMLFCHIMCKSSKFSERVIWIPWLVNERGFLAINSCKARAAELQQLTLAPAGAKSQMVTCHYCHRSATEFTNICQAVQNTVHTICYRIQAALDNILSGYSTVLRNKQMIPCVGPTLTSISLFFRGRLVLLKRITIHTREDLVLCTAHGKVKSDIYKALLSNMVSLTVCC